MDTENTTKSSSSVLPDYAKAILVGAHVKGAHPLLPLNESLDELAQLAATVEVMEIGRLTQQVGHIEPATFIGSGKVEELVELVRDTGAGTVIFDDELSPRHQRELAERLGENVKLLDRSALILDIFARHARTREGALQVELAQYEYRLPRLTRQWTHLSRQVGGGARGGAGGVGVRGPGETQLEVDRREISRRIIHLKDDIEKVRQQRLIQRQQRRKAGIPVISLLGYTNAGKSTLLKALSGADIYIADKLFATLDPTTRRVSLPSGRQVLVTDTVGFIQKLPTTLIAAFRATLEEITEADVILHVVDTSHPNVSAHIEAVEDILAEMDVPEDLTRVLVWNKIDRWGDQPLPHSPESHDVEVKISAETGEGVDDLLHVLEDIASTTLVRVTLLIPYNRGEILSQLHDSARVIETESIEEGSRIEVEIPRRLVDRFESYRV